MSNEKQPPTQVSRRQFVGTVAPPPPGSRSCRATCWAAGFQAPSDTVNVAVVGYAHGMGTPTCSTWRRATTSSRSATATRAPPPRQPLKRRGIAGEASRRRSSYKDYRVMLEKQKDIDAVLVATPDHTHAVIAMAAMQLGKHVYVQKPLTRTISEARALTEAARKYKVVTQMGNQGHSEEGLRLMQEWIDGRRDRPGARGALLDQPPDLAAGHAAADRHAGRARRARLGPVDRPGADAPVPHGPTTRSAGARGRTSAPARWATWRCHVMDASFTILKLGSPTSVIASLGLQLPAAGAGAARVRPARRVQRQLPAVVDRSTCRFPARGNMPPVKLHWYDGGLLPERPEDLEPERKLPESGTIFVGDKGKMWCETYSESPRLIPESAMQAFQRPPKTLPRVPEGRAGHEKNWLDAIRQKGQAVSNFDYAGPFTETVLLGNVALRFPGQRLLWDGPTMKVTNVPEAEPVRPAQLPPGLVAVRPLTVSRPCRSRAARLRQRPRRDRLLFHACR